MESFAGAIRVDLDGSRAHLKNHLVTDWKINYQAKFFYAYSGHTELQVSLDDLKKEIIKLRDLQKNMDIWKEWDEMLFDYSKFGKKLADPNSIILIDANIQQETGKNISLTILDNHDSKIYESKY